MNLCVNYLIEDSKNYKCERINILLRWLVNSLKLALYPGPILNVLLIKSCCLVAIVKAELMLKNIVFFSINTCQFSLIRTVF